MIKNINRKLKIGFILPGSGRSGGIKSTVKSANGLFDRGHDVRIFVHGGGRTLYSLARDLYIKVCFTSGHDWLSMFKGRVVYFNDLKKCDFKRGEILVASGGQAAAELRDVNDNGIKKVHYIRGIDSFDREKMRAVWGENVPKIAVAEYLREAFERICDQRLLAVIPNGVDMYEYYPAVPEKERDGVGTIYGQAFHKDPDTVLAVLDQLRESCPGLPLRVFGACKRPRRIPSSEYSRLPSLDESREIYSRSIVWFLGSRSEGFPAPPLEAMCCGCAVISTDCGGAEDIIKDGENGFLVKVGDVKGLVGKIKLLLQDIELRKRFVAKSLQTVQQFTWERSIDMLEKVLFSIYEADIDGHPAF